MHDNLNVIANIKRLIIGTTFTKFLNEEVIAKVLLCNLIIIGEAFVNVLSNV